MENSETFISYVNLQNVNDYIMVCEGSAYSVLSAQ